jgi:tripartite-type tricarboxylate transporter receptor subunit TctC
MQRNRLILLAALGLACATTKAGAQSYPSRPITMVVPFAAGAPVDMVGRLIAERMRVPLGQPIIPENVSGAAGSLGVGRAAQTAADG